MEEPEVIEHFFGVYLLYCMNEKYKGRTYIGYTVNPNRRIKQHNAGKEFGGACKTNNKGPWKMVLIVHGFPNSTSALTFEWAWQHPTSSRRLKHIDVRKSRKKVFDYCLEVLSKMLNVGPWYRLPLTIRWLDDDFYIKYATSISPPMHMPITHGPVVTKKLKSENTKKYKTKSQSTSKSKNHSKSKSEVQSEVESKSQSSSEPQAGSSKVYCLLCDLPVEQDDKITCVTRGCFLVAHILCLGKSFWKDDGMILPIDGMCPACDNNVLWGDLIRKMLGCNLHLSEESEDLGKKSAENLGEILGEEDSNSSDDFET